MGENVKVTEEQSSADRLREQIRHTEGDITETVHTLERRLSPSYLREQGTRKAKLAGWQGVAKFLEYAQRTSVQLSVAGAGAGTIVMLLTKRSRPKVTARKVFKDVSQMETGKAATTFGASLLWMLLRNKLAPRTRAEKPAISGLALAATAAKAFLSGARDTKKTGTTRPGRKQAWRGFANSLGAALGSYWYSHRGRRV